MIPRSHQFVRKIVLGVLFLLMAGASPALVSIDDDGDDATPAVVVEFDFGLPCKKIINLPKAQRTTVTAAVMPEPSKLAANFKHYGLHASDESTLPLIVPLRT